MQQPVKINSVPSKGKKKPVKSVGTKPVKKVTSGPKKTKSGMWVDEDKFIPPFDYKNGGKVKKKSFPDLNKDGKVTKADILKGRGVIAKKGAMIKKCKTGCK
jgi:hypothetical protein